MSQSLKIFLLIFFIAFINLVIVFLLFGIQEDRDTGTYINVINYFAGKPHDELHLGRIIKPLAPLVAAPFEPFLGAKNSLIFENILFYFAAAFLIFKITDLIYRNKKQAIFSVIIFVSSYSVIRWGLAALTDMSGWFFFILSIYLTLLFLRKRDIRLIWLNGFLSGAGLLFKETGAMGALFFILVLVIFSEFFWKEKARYAFNYFLAFGIPVFSASLFIYWKFHYSFIDWFIYAEEVKIHYGFKRSLLYFFENIFSLMFFGWFFVLRGAYKEFKYSNSRRTKILLSFIIPSLSFIVWPFKVVRLMFIAGPLLSILASRGLIFKSRIKQFLGYAALGFIVIFNFLFPKVFNLSYFQDFIDNYLHL